LLRWFITRNIKVNEDSWKKRRQQFIQGPFCAEVCSKKMLLSSGE
jgi:hypothetical protein